MDTFIFDEIKLIPQNYADRKESTTAGIDHAIYQSGLKLGNQRSTNCLPNNPNCLPTKGPVEHYSDPLSSFFDSKENLLSKFQPVMHNLKIPLLFHSNFQSLYTLTSFYHYECANGRIRKPPRTKVWKGEAQLIFISLLTRLLIWHCTIEASCQQPP